MTVITDWYDGETIMITGGTGFMGKVLLEKLLRSCCGIRCIYILARPKRGTPPSVRIEEMAKLPLFENLVKNNPGIMKKLIAIESDMSKPDLGLSNDQKQTLISEVEIVFNMAASLRLEAGLKDAIANNTTSTKYILDLCSQMKQLKAFVHLSTAFCHCEHEVLEEKVYPPPHNPHDIIHAMEWMDDKAIELITPRILGPHPNSYTYSKRLSEYLVYEYKDKFSVCIARPSIVTPAYKEPIPGWVDTLNGPIGVLVGGGKGVIRTMMCGADYVAEIVPVDVAINGLVTIAWKLSTEKTKNEPVPVYNLTSGNVVGRVTWREVLNVGREMIYKHPFETVMWYPGGDITSSWLVHYFCIVFFHYLPAYCIDFLLLLAMQKRFMVRIQNRITVGLGVLQFFTMRQWLFRNEKFLEIEDNLTEEDRNIFNIKNIDRNLSKYLVNCILGARVYCMKEPLSSLPRARRIHFVLYILHCFVRVLFYGFLAWLLLKYVDSARILLDYSANVLHRIPVIGGLIPLTVEGN